MNIDAAALVSERFSVDDLLQVIEDARKRVQAVAAVATTEQPIPVVGR